MNHASAEYDAVLVGSEIAEYFFTYIYVYVSGLWTGFLSVEISEVPGSIPSRVNAVKPTFLYCIERGCGNIIVFDFRTVL